jgi:hypothetical protein
MMFIARSRGITLDEARRILGIEARQYDALAQEIFRKRKGRLFFATQGILAARPDRTVSESRVRAMAADLRFKQILADIDANRSLTEAIQRYRRAVDPAPRSVAIASLAASAAAILLAAGLFLESTRARMPIPTNPKDSPVIIQERIASLEREQVKQTELSSLRSELNQKLTASKEIRPPALPDTSAFDQKFRSITDKAQATDGRLSKLETILRSFDDLLGELRRSSQEDLATFSARLDAIKLPPPGVRPEEVQTMIRKAVGDLEAKIAARPAPLVTAVLPATPVEHAVTSRVDVPPQPVQPIDKPVGQSRSALNKSLQAALDVVEEYPNMAEVHLRAFRRSCADEASYNAAVQATRNPTLINLSHKLIRAL